MEEEDLAKVRHDIGNALSIARSSVEAMLDGVVGVTDPRLNRLRELLNAVSDGMDRLFDSTIPKVQETPAATDPIAEQLTALTPIAEMKGIRFLYEPAGKGNLRTILLQVLRESLDGSIVHIARADDNLVILRTERSINDS